MLGGIGHWISLAHLFDSSKQFLIECFQPIYCSSYFYFRIHSTTKTFPSKSFGSHGDKKLTLGHSSNSFPTKRPPQQHFLFSSIHSSQKCCSHMTCVWEQTHWNAGKRDFFKFWPRYFSKMPQKSFLLYSKHKKVYIHSTFLAQCTWI